jgi:hypothetical protein
MEGDVGPLGADDFSLCVTGPIFAEKTGFAHDMIFLGFPGIYSSMQAGEEGMVFEGMKTERSTETGVGDGVGLGLESFRLDLPVALSRRTASMSRMIRPPFSR